MGEVKTLWKKYAKTFLAKANNTAKKQGRSADQPALHLAIQKAFYSMDICTKLDDYESLVIQFPEILQSEAELDRVWDIITALTSTGFSEADQPDEIERENFHLFNQAMPLLSLRTPEQLQPDPTISLSLTATEPL
jgi:hypothetical protein